VCVCVRESECKIVNNKSNYTWPKIFYGCFLCVSFIRNISLSLSISLNVLLCMAKFCDCETKTYEKRKEFLSMLYWHIMAQTDFNLALK